MVLREVDPPAFLHPPRLGLGEDGEPPPGQLYLHRHRRHGGRAEAKLHVGIEDLRQGFAELSAIRGGDEIIAFGEAVEAFVDQRAEVGGPKFAGVVGDGS